MSDPFDSLIDPLLAREGGYVADPRDPGGATCYGVTEAVARQSGYAGSMRDLTRDQAKAIYRRNYWTAPGFDRVAALSPPIAAELFDTGVNQGIIVAATYLQRALNALGASNPDLKTDGQIGDVTITSLRAFLAKRGNGAGGAVILTALNCLQGARYIEIAEGRPASRAFAFGWLNNRIRLET